MAEPSGGLEVLRQVRQANEEAEEEELRRELEEGTREGVPTSTWRAAGGGQ